MTDNKIELIMSILDIQSRFDFYSSLKPDLKLKESYTLIELQDKSETFLETYHKKLLNLKMQAKRILNGLYGLPKEKESK